MFESFKECLEEFLLSNGIDIHESDYRNMENYKEIKESRILSSNGISISLDEFIEHYLLEKLDVIDNYESKYDMGNVYELDEDECEDAEVAKEIITIQGLVSKNDIDAEVSEFVKKFTRKGGLIERLNTYLDFDFELFDKENKNYKYERCKILYFFYMLENTYFPKINVLMLLRKPSMENMDNLLVNMQTYNGSIIKFIKDSIEKELISSPMREKIKKEVAEIVSTWDNVLKSIQINIDLGRYSYDLKKIIDPLTYLQKESSKSYIHSPLETLYLKIVQHEYIGNVIDIDFINSISKIPKNCNISSEFIGEMKKFYYSHINIDNVRQYIDKNAHKISKYVYLRDEISKEDVRRIKKCKEKVCRLIDFCYRANPLLDIKEISNELQIISFLQAIILEEQNEIFDYIFYGYQNHNKHKPQVQAALKNNKYTCHALQIYWIHKSMDYFYANIGKYEVRVKMRELEKACDHVLKNILSKSNLCEMQEIHRFYINELVKYLNVAENQNIALQFLIDYLRCRGFRFIDKVNKIHSAFLYPDEIGSMCRSLVELIDDTIKDKDSLLQITQEPDSSGRKGFYLELAFDYQNNECILQKFKLL